MCDIVAKTRGMGEQRRLIDYGGETRQHDMVCKFEQDSISTKDLLIALNTKLFG